MANCKCGKGKTRSGMGYLICNDPQCPEQVKIDESRETLQKKAALDDEVLVKFGVHPSQPRQKTRSKSVISLGRLNMLHARQAELAAIRAIR